MENIEILSQMKRETNRMIEELSDLMVMPVLNIKGMIDEDIDPYNSILPSEYIVKEYNYTLKLYQRYKQYKSKTIETLNVNYIVKESTNIKNRYYIQMISNLTNTYRGEAILDNITDINLIDLNLVKTLNFEY